MSSVTGELLCWGVYVNGVNYKKMPHVFRMEDQADEWISSLTRQRGVGEIVKVALVKVEGDRDD